MSRLLIAAAAAAILSACATAPDDLTPPEPAPPPLALQAACPSPLLFKPMDNDWAWRDIYSRCRDAALYPQPKRIRVPKP